MKFLALVALLLTAIPADSAEYHCYDHGNGHG